MNMMNTPQNPMGGTEQPMSMQGSNVQDRDFLPSDNKEGANNNMFESAFNDMAYNVFSTKFPELVSSIVTFKVLESDVDTGLAVGTFIVQHEGEDLYVPAVLSEDNIKPMELMYSKRLDKFLPLKKEWLELLMSTAEDSLGKASIPPEEMSSDIDISRLMAPPMNGRFGYAGDEDLTFIDCLKNASNQTKTAFVNILKEDEKLFKFAFENFDKEELISSLKTAADKDKKSKSTHAAGNTDLIVVDNNTPSKTVKEVFGDKAPEAMKVIATEGFAHKDTRTDTSRAYATDTLLKLEEPSANGTYNLYKGDGTVVKAYVFAARKAHIPSHSDSCQTVACSEGYFGNKESHFVILENGDYYLMDKLIGTSINPSEFDNKVYNTIVGNETSVPKVGDKIMFVKVRPHKAFGFGPMKVSTITSDDKGKKYVENYDHKESDGSYDARVCVYHRDTPTNTIVGDPNMSNAPVMIPTDYNVLVLGKKLNEKELLGNLQQTMNLINEKLLVGGANKVKVANAGFGEYNINGAHGLSKQAAFLQLTNSHKINGSDALALLNTVKTAGEHVSSYIVNVECSEKVGSIFNAGASGTQITPEQAQMAAGASQQPTGASPTESSVVPQNNVSSQGDSSSLMREALKMKNPELFNVGAISSLAHTSSIKDLIAVYIPHLEKSLDSIGRIMLTLWMQGDKIKDEMGNTSHQEVEDKLRNVFTGLGEIILKLSKNASLLQE